MKAGLKVLCALAVAVLCLGSHAWGAICPTTSNTNTDCGFILTIGPSGITGAAVPGANPYDGSDDALLGIVNNSGSAFTGSITLSGSGNGGGLFAFDGDGICDYVSAPYCAKAPTGYEGPLVTFANISPGGVSGDVVVTGLADGASTYFSLEGSPSSISGGGGIGLPGGGQVPEPSSILLLATGALGAATTLRRRIFQ